MNIFNFEYKRVVLVDSADLCYVEIPLDQHAILLGKGNIGKSSILNSLRLFLLPENNFANCKNKFSFRSKDGIYTKDQSFQHYFPSTRSFLILEVKNTTGYHCQVLYKAKNYHYHRLFVPLAYEQIRDLFWQCDDDDREQIGRAVEGLSLASVMKKIKQRAPQAQSVSDTGKLKELLYANDLISDIKTKYSLFPLVDNNASKIDSLKTLLLLLFDMSANRGSMATAVAHIIEADKKSQDDRLDFDINQFLKDHEKFEQEEGELNKIKNKQGMFNQLKNKVTQYKKLSAADWQFIHFTYQLEKEKTKQLHNKRKITDKIIPLQQEQARLNGNINNARNKLIEVRATITQKTNELEQAKEACQRGGIVCQDYKELSTNEIIETLNHAINKTESHINALNDDHLAEQQRIVLNKAIAKHKNTIQQLQDSIANKEYILTKQLLPETSHVLAAINKKLLRVNPKQVLNAEDKETIECFTRLFVAFDDGYHWFDTEFKKQSVEFDEDLEALLVGQQGRLQEKISELNELQQPSNSLHHEKNIKHQQEKLADLQRKADVMKKYSVAKVVLPDFSAVLEDMIIDQTNAQAHCVIQETDCDNVNKKLKVLIIEQAIFDIQLEKYYALEQSCQRLKKSYPRVVQMAKTITIDEEKATATLLTTIQLEQIESDLADFDQLREKIINAIRDFIYSKIIDDEDGFLRDAPKSSTVNKTFTRLEEVFTELPQKYSHLKDQIATHNGLVGKYTKVLTDQDTHIQYFKEQLNKEFSTVSINDLEKIEVDIQIDRRFKNLVAEINKEDFFSDHLLSERFYQRLSVFVSTFFEHQNDAHLTMDKIVTGLTYRIQKKGSKGWQNKKQSDSTTSLINLELVRLLLNRIKKSGCHITFPLVHDELANISLDQFDWLLPRLTKQGFNLFSAGTHSTSSELVYKIKNFHEIGSMRTAYPYHENRTIVYWGGAEQFLSTADAKQTKVAFAEQSSLSLSS